MCHHLADLPASVPPWEEGSQTLQPTLFVNAVPRRRSLYEQPLEDGRVAEIYLPPRFVAVGLALAEAYHLDGEGRDVPAKLRGFLTPEEVGEAVAGLGGARNVLEADAVVAYVRDFRKTVRVEIRGVVARDVLVDQIYGPIETQPTLGYRVGRNGVRIACSCGRRD